MFEPVPNNPYLLSSFLPEPCFYLLEDKKLGRYKADPVYAANAAYVATVIWFIPGLYIYFC